MPRTTIEEHLTKSSELKKSANDQLKHGSSSNTIAEKLGWPEPLVWAIALEGKDDKECFAELKWNCGTPRELWTMAECELLDNSLHWSAIQARAWSTIPGPGELPAALFFGRAR